MKQFFAALTVKSIFIHLENILKITYFDNNVFLLSSNGLISGNPFQNHISTWSNPADLKNETTLDIHQDKESLFILSSNSISG